MVPTEALATKNLICLHTWNTSSQQIPNHPRFKNLYLPRLIFTCTYQPLQDVYSVDRILTARYFCQSHWYLMHQITETERLINASYSLSVIVYNLVINMNYYRYPFTRRPTSPYKPVLKSVSTKLVGTMYLFVIVHQWNQLTFSFYDSIMSIFYTLSNLNVISNDFDVLKPFITNRCVLW